MQILIQQIRLSPLACSGQAEKNETVRMRSVANGFAFD